MISCSTMLALILGKILRSGHSIWTCVDGVHHFLKAIAGITSTGRVITNDCCTESISKGHCYSCITLNKFGGTMQILKILLAVNCARAVYRERKKYIDEIDWNMLVVPPTGSHKAHNTELEDEQPTKVDFHQPLSRDLSINFTGSRPQELSQFQNLLSLSLFSNY